ncbi:hypothetical protein F511_16973 [Dorcoceras hygrometricum]|uniref:Uncharacterized protein n=1 Tax=Dorcoceras hygrometricum TaxID=472368 RepID=A0A2Z7ABJ7_9LAMI|nr:hypothetical protein F511_16973 [Dorcoceras hygrometricum]
MLRAALGRTPAATSAAHGAGCANQWRNIYLLAGQNRATIACKIAASHGRQRATILRGQPSASSRPPGATSAPLSHAAPASHRATIAQGCAAMRCDHHAAVRAIASGFLRRRAWLQPESQGDWLFTVGGGRLRLIRSTTGFDLPPISLHYKADGFYHERNHLVARIRTSPIVRRSDDGGRRRDATVGEVAQHIELSFRAGITNPVLV